MEAGSQDCLRARSKSQRVGSDQFPTEDSWDKQIHGMTPPFGDCSSLLCWGRKQLRGYEPFAENYSIWSLKAMLMGTVSASVVLHGGTFLKTVP